MQMVPGDATGEEISNFPAVQIPVETGVWHRVMEANSECMGYFRQMPRTGFLHSMCWGREGTLVLMKSS